MKEAQTTKKAHTEEGAAVGPHAAAARSAARKEVPAQA